VTVNNTPVTVNAAGFFTYSIPIPDEAQEYTVHVVARLGDDEMSDERTVSYSPAKAPLTLTITSPVDGQVIKQNVIRISGKTSPRAKVTVNNRTVNVSSNGIITSDLQLTERDIGDYILEIVANDDSSEVMKSVNLKIDATSPQVNISVPVLNVVVQGPQLTSQATRNSKVLINVSDRTPDDQITVVIQDNGSREELLLDNNGQGSFDLDEGKNVYTVQAHDKAGNVSNTVQGNLYYLPGPILIDLIEPSDNTMTVEDLPPMPRPTILPKIMVEVELNDGIRNVPETIRWVRVTDNTGRTFQLLDKKNYHYAIEVPLARGPNTFTVHAQDIADNMGTKTFSVNIK
jgi:hypothetical protein